MPNDKHLALILGCDCANIGPHPSIFSIIRPKIIYNLLFGVKYRPININFARNLGNPSNLRFSLSFVFSRRSKRSRPKLFSAADRYASPRVLCVCCTCVTPRATSCPRASPSPSSSPLHLLRGSSSPRFLPPPPKIGSIFALSRGMCNVPTYALRETRARCARVNEARNVLAERSEASTLGLC